jgi:hypothetical protein
MQRIPGKGYILSGRVLLLPAVSVPPPRKDVIYMYRAEPYRTQLYYKRLGFVMFDA